MEVDPFAGDVRRLAGIDEWRRRVGDWRILFAVDFMDRTVRRRTSTTYRG